MSILGAYHILKILRGLSWMDILKLLAVLCIIGGVTAFLSHINAAENYHTNPKQELRYVDDNVERGNYRVLFAPSNGVKQLQQELRNEGTKEKPLIVRGSYSLVGPDGVTYIVTHSADKNGVQPQIEQGPGGGVQTGVFATLLG